MSPSLRSPWPGEPNPGAQERGARSREHRRVVWPMIAPPPRWFCRLCWPAWGAARSRRPEHQPRRGRLGARPRGSRQLSKLRACIPARSRRCGWSGYSASPPLSWGSDRRSAESGSGHSLLVVALQPARILAAKGRPGAEWPFRSLWNPGGEAGGAPATLPSPPNSVGLRWSTCFSL